MHTPFPLRKQGLLLLLGSLASAQALSVTTYAGDPGKTGDPGSWRTAEFLRDWGLRAIGAEYAYAAGFSGQGIKVGLVDSGYFDTHPELVASRYRGVTVNGVLGSYNQAYNDSHGTHVVGTVGASRDGGTGTTNFHGVAFNTEIYAGNTGKTDSVLYGLPQASQSATQTIDNAYVGNVFRSVNAAGVRVLGSSFGSQPNTEQYQTLLPSADATLAGRTGLLGAWAYLSGQTGTDTWFRGALDAARTGTIVAFSAGNGGYTNPSPRAAAAYFDPSLEATWLGVSAIRSTGQIFSADGAVNVPGTQHYNQCGVAKWSCMTAPGSSINGSTVTVNAEGIATATYGSKSGTSMAQPHAAGALAVIMERYAYMSNAQALEVMKTTAIQNATINDASGLSITNPDAGKLVEVPDSRNGWGTVSLRHAMNGPGQFSGRFAADLQGQTDTWSNSISDKAIKARKLEDAAEALAWAARKDERGWNIGLPADASTDDRAEYLTGIAREEARNARGYEGSLAMVGAGTLILSGDNSFSGGAEVHAGTLVAASATALGSGSVTVLGGTLATRSAATVLIDGDLTLGAGSVLDLGMGDGSSAALSVVGHAVLAGSLTLSFASGVAGVGTYDLLNFGRYEGGFSSFSYVGLDAGLQAALVLGADGIDVSITAVPEPQTYLLLLGGLGLIAWLARRRRT